MTHEDLVRAYGCGPPMQSASGLRTRTKELVDIGLIRQSGRTVRLPSGRRGIVWVAA